MSRSTSGSALFANYLKGKMAGIDPSLWTVDQVIDQICSKESSLYQDQLPPTKGKLDLNLLETALRDQLIDGEDFINLNQENLRNDLGLTALGARNELMKIVDHLQEISVIFQEKNNKIVKRRLESDGEQESKEGTSEPPPEAKKRRIQPELLSAKPISAPEEFDDRALTDAERAFLARHEQPSDIESLRPYDESDSEVEIRSDDSLYDEIESEGEIIPTPQLSSDEVYDIIDGTIQDFRHSWISHKQPNKYKKAFDRWMSAAKAGTRKPQQNALQAEIATFRTRLAKFRKGVHDMSRDSLKIEDIKQVCLNLQVTVEAIAEREYFLQVLEGSQPPPKPENITAPAQVIPKDLGEDEEILESESETEESTEAFLDDTSASGSDISLEYDLTDNDWNPQVPLETIPEQAEPYTEDLFSLDTLPKPALEDLPQQAYTPPRQTAPAFTEHFVPAQYQLLPMPKLAVSTGESTVPVKTRQETPNLLEIVQNSIEDQIDEELEINLFEERLPQSRYRLQGATFDDAIDLGSSPVSSEFSRSNSIHTPPLNPETPTKYFESRRPPPPDFPSIRETRVKKYGDIGNDTFLLLCKSVYKRSRDVASDVLDKINALGPKEIKDALSAMIAEWQDSIGENESLVDGEEDMDFVWAYFYIVFACGTHVRRVEDVSEESLDTAFNQIPTKAVKFDRILKPLLQWYIKTETNPSGQFDKEPSFTQQHKWVKQANGGFNGRSSTVSTFVGETRKSPTPVTTDTESDLDTVPNNSQKRKRHVQQSQEALQRQKDDRYRVEEQEEQRRKLMMQRFQAFAGDEDVAPIPINTEQPIVYLDKHIAARVKPHQIEGIQFIWRELVDDPKHQGCLLAHTMGLGKTMQVVSFLVTLARTNQDPQLRHHLPPHLRSNRILIICPASLVDNWYDEILMWTPPPILGPIYRIHGTRKQKIETVAAWEESSGTLIVGYESFKALLKKPRNGTDEELAYLERSLLARPCVVVADEAHKLKNTKSAVNKVATQVATKSRIALTGSPLNNHLEEYHTMINWIAPDYLGTLTQFRAKYSEPIERGLYADSTRYDKRKSLEKLYVLKRDLAPKIHRKDISAIAKDMPQKTEFFITVPLTEIQRKIYTTMVEFILKSVGSSTGKAIKSTNAQLWAWLSILSWLCNHPSCFMRKLEEKNPDAAAAAHASLSNIESLPDDEFDETTAADNFDVTESPLAALLPKYLSYFEGIDREDPSLSMRSTVTSRLIRESVAQGDKILIFSHSIPTLDYLQDMVTSMDLECMRIDGTTKTDQRQDATKYFNDSSSTISVFLISTRAGGLGLNLQGANRVIIYDFGFNPSWEEQAIGRAYRLGQKKPVFVYRFRAGGTFEEAIYNKAIFKTQLFSRVVDQKNVIRHASKQIEDYLFVPKEAQQEDLDECLGKDALLDKIVQQIPDAIRGLVLTETFQREDEDDVMTPEEKRAADEAYKLEQLARTDPVQYHKALVMREQKERVERMKASYPSSWSGDQKPTFEQVWNANTLNASGEQPRPVQPAADEGFEVIESKSLSPKEDKAVSDCPNQ